MISTVTATSETERQIRNVLLGSARVKAWVSTLSGAMLMVFAPFWADLAQNADAPFAREIAMVLFAIGAGCILLAISARREVSLLRSQLQESDFRAFADFIGVAATRPESSKARTVAVQEPLHAA